jgi:hypothetical protein
MTDNLLAAEECIDRQAKTEAFEGRSFEWVTGRVLLHAISNDGHSLCGRPSNLLTPTERPWEATCLPHLPRCQGCLTARPAAAIIGAPAAAEELAQHTVYSWLYSQILANPVWFPDYLDRHGLHPPEHPPVPRRYFGEAWWIT